MNTILPADDVLLRGYCGAIEWCAVGAPDAKWRVAVWGPIGPSSGDQTRMGPVNMGDNRGAEFRLNCALPAVRDHVSRVCAAGVMCRGDDCNGTGKVRGTYVGPLGAPTYQCPECQGSGWELRPAPIEHLMDRPGSKLTAAQSAVLVADSWRRWRAGARVVRGVYGPDVPHPTNLHYRRRYLLAGAGEEDPSPAAEFAQDRWAALLADDHALIEDDGSITLPTLLGA